MKGNGNDGRGNIPERDLWETDTNLWNILNEQYGFDFDCCASEKNSKCERWSEDFVSIKELEHSTAWMNPPFSISKKMFTHFFNVVNEGVAIYRCDNMETYVWQEIILPRATWIFIPKGRVSYETYETGDMRGGKGSRFPSALIGIKVEPPRGLSGVVLFPEHEMQKQEFQEEGGLEE